jgi:hypothetical protein
MNEVVVLKVILMVLFLRMANGAHDATGGAELANGGAFACE